MMLECNAEVIECSVIDIEIFLRVGLDLLLSLTLPEKFLLIPLGVGIAVEWMEEVFRQYMV